jgi:hypothetical protein
MKIKHDFKLDKYVAERGALRSKIKNQSQSMTAKAIMSQFGSKRVGGYE